MDSAGSLAPARSALGLALFLLLALPDGALRAASFSAELVDTRPGLTRSGRGYFQDGSYRLEVGEGESSMVVLFEAATRTTYLMVPSQRMYLQAGPDEVAARASTPFGSYAYFAAREEVRADGTEAVDGIPCTRRVVSGRGQVFAIAWISSEFEIPLKVYSTLPERTMEFRNLVRGPQDPALFTVPPDWRRMEPEVEPLPEWAAQVAGAPERSPPFEITLAQGEILRIPPLAGKRIEIKATHAAGENAAFTAVRFKDGRPLSSIPGNTMNLAPEQECTSTFSVAPGEADAYVIRIREGSVKFVAGFVSAAAGPGDPVTAPTSEPTGGSGPEVRIEAPPTAGVAERFPVAWSGPGDRDDHVTVARSEQPAAAYVSRALLREGNPLKVLAPSDPGEYEIRYILGRGARVLARVPIRIEPATAAFEIAGPVVVAAPIEAKWQGPAREGDFVSVARRDHGPGAYEMQTAVRHGNPAKLRAPSDPGEYEIRYVLGRGARVLARVPITVLPVTATLRPPASAKTGVEFEVAWTGPGYREDYLTVAREGKPPGAYETSRPVRVGNPLRIRAPKEPGSYEVRYILGRGNRLLGKTTIVIEAP